MKSEKTKNGTADQKHSRTEKPSTQTPISSSSPPSQKQTTGRHDSYSEDVEEQEKYSPDIEAEYGEDEEDLEPVNKTKSGKKDH